MKKKVLDENLNTSEKVDLYFALAKAYEDLGEIERSFEYLKKGNKLKRDIIKFDIDFEKKTFEDIKNLFSKINFEDFKDQTNNNKNIIFILGMPRSGTTLTEQIISAHSKVYGSGELPYLTTIVNEKFYENKSLSNLKINKIINNDKKIFITAEDYYSYIKIIKSLRNILQIKRRLIFYGLGL